MLSLVLHVLYGDSHIMYKMTNIQFDFQIGLLLSLFIYRVKYAY